MAVPVLSIEQMRQWERATWAAGRTEAEVIARVGELVAARALEMTRSQDAVLILAGRGHNGDDARAAAPHLGARVVTTLDVAEPPAALEQLEKLFLTTRPALIIDGLFGIGINRRLSPDWQQLIGAVNASAVPILAVDVPSGLNGDTGEAMGAAIRASVTLTVGAPKAGLLKAKAWEFAGRLEVAPEIGLIRWEEAFEHESVCGDKTLHWTLPQDFRNFPPTRQIAGHKGTFGHVVLIAGSIGYHGAAVLAARGALRARPGLVSVLVQENVYLPVASQLQAAMVHSWGLEQPFPASASALVFGPGLASDELPESLAHQLRNLWQKSPLPIVADASALEWLPAGAIAGGRLRIITPHPGEAGRLLKRSAAEVQADRPGAVRQLSSRYGDCWVVLKGHQTLIGRSTGSIQVNGTGNPYLAQGGSGDVLAGYLGGLLAQPELQSDPAQTTGFAVWLHGATADRLSAGENSWGIEELVSNLGSRRDQ